MRPSPFPQSLGFLGAGGYRWWLAPFLPAITPWQLTLTTFLIVLESSNFFARELGLPEIPDGVQPLGRHL